ncbi:hypothetical protein [Chachezhania sediminis]|uniref:hypothetical protein n=1 Tax=Chachezhania sediminis TaxID=2599291 RepID=UPI00131B2563|nr:hypothetical protein [Chachezhania sediminis]
MTRENETFPERDKAKKDIPAQRTCLRCQSSFASDGFGQRICARCKGSSVWRSAAPSGFGMDRRRVSGGAS